MSGFTSAELYAQTATYWDPTIGKWVTVGVYSPVVAPVPDSDRTGPLTAGNVAALIPRQYG